MKKPEYAALVTEMYKKYVDLYQCAGRKGYKVDPEDIRCLMDMYNRGGFTDGYYKQHNGRNMISLTKPNHFGTQAAKVSCINNNKITLQALCDLNEKDVLEYGSGPKAETVFTLDRAVRAGGQFNVQVPGFKSISKNGIFYRTRNEKLIRDIQTNVIRNEKKEKIYGSLKVLKGLPVRLTISGFGSETAVDGETVTKAMSRPLTKDELVRRILKTGNTPFEFDGLEIELDEQAYLSIQGLNQLRRDGLAAFEEKLLRRYERTALDKALPILDIDCGNERKEPVRLNVSISKLSYLDII